MSDWDETTICACCLEDVHCDFAKLGPPASDYEGEDLCPDCYEIIVDEMGYEEDEEDES